MNTRRVFVFGSAFATIGGLRPVCAQVQPGATEATLREAILQYVAIWNRHDVQAWSTMLTDDIWYTEASDFYERMKGRKAVLTTFEYNVQSSDLLWEVRRVRMMPDGTATVVLRHVAQILPKVDGKYKASYESVPSLSRWRHEGGKWRMFFFTSDKGWALAEMKKDGVE
ncbi:MAG: nuclear transport factor 2 family protein [Pseudomonadota bacterium]